MIDLHYVSFPNSLINTLELFYYYASRSLGRNVEGERVFISLFSLEPDAWMASHVFRGLIVLKNETHLFMIRDLRRVGD